MKILYGAQATGNGHVTRARAMAPTFNKAGLDVDYLFSGRDPEKTVRHGTIWQLPLPQRADFLHSCRKNCSTSHT